MNLVLKRTMPSLLKDWPMPSTLFGPEFFDGDIELPSFRLGVTVPSANVSETKKEYLLELAAPGLERKDFNVEVENHTLFISAEKEYSKEESEEDYTRREYSYDSFRRSFALPENVKEENIDARYENGVLKVSIPKIKETPVMTKTISVS